MSIHSFCKNSGKFQHLLYHHSNSIKYFMQWCFAHESTGGDDLIFLINMSLIHMLTDVLAAKLRNSFCRVWNIWIPESQKFRQYASVLSFYTNINIFINNMANSKRQFYIKIHGLYKQNSAFSVGSVFPFFAVSSHFHHILLNEEQGIDDALQLRLDYN